MSERPDGIGAPRAVHPKPQPPTLSWPKKAARASLDAGS